MDGKLCKDQDGLALCWAQIHGRSGTLVLERLRQILFAARPYTTTGRSAVEHLYNAHLGTGRRGKLGNHQALRLGDCSARRRNRDLILG